MRRALWVLIALALAAGSLAEATPALANRDTRVTPLVRVVREVAPAVVNVLSKSRRKVNVFSFGDRDLDKFFEDFFEPMEREETSLGSGVIIDGERGLIVTNAHVVSASDEVRVQLADKRTFAAQIIGSDPDTDLAVLKIDTRAGLPSARLGESADLMIGEDVFAIGNAYGLSHTVTRGVVSALGRKVRASRDHWIRDLIQTDASINPGNSGGPLLNADGEVVGINTAIFQRAQGIGFAIPIARVKRVVDDLVAFGEVIPAWLGLELQELTPRLAEYFGLQRVVGLMVLEVSEASPAAQSGLQRSDLIMEMQGRVLEEIGDFRSGLRAVGPGDEVEILVRRQGKEKRLAVKAQAFPEARAMEVAWRRLGFDVVDLEPEVARMHRVPLGFGVAIKELRKGSRAEAIGLKPTDLILAVGDKRTKKVEAFLHHMSRVRLQDSITVLVQRGPHRQYVTLGR